MKRRFDLSLGQTIAVILAGALLMASTFLLAPLLHLERGHGAPTFLLRLILPFSLLLAGGYLNIKGSRELKDGLANQRWPREAVAVFHATFESFLWVAFSFGMMFAGCFMMFRSTHPHDIAWFLLILGQSLSRLSWGFRQPPPSNDWRNGSALSSQHWGDH